MTHLSLFSGVGGIDLAAEWAGFKTVAFVERDKFCQKVLAKHWPNTPIYDDITTFDGTRFRGVDLVSGGFPCQPHSLAGKRKASSDERDLWGEMRRVVGEARPEWVVAENVPGLFSSESGRFFGRVISDLAEMGYRVGWCCYGASDVGANHIRKRIFMVAHTNSDSKPVIPKHDEAHVMPNYARSHWERQPRSVRVDDGVSRRLDSNRLRALGNAVVPQQIYPILKAIAEVL